MNFTYLAVLVKVHCLENRVLSVLSFRWRFLQGLSIWDKYFDQNFGALRNSLILHFLVVGVETEFISALARNRLCYDQFCFICESREALTFPSGQIPYCTAGELLPPKVSRVVVCARHGAGSSAGRRPGAWRNRYRPCLPGGWWWGAGLQRYRTLCVRTGRRRRTEQIESIDRGLATKLPARAHKMTAFTSPLEK